MASTRRPCAKALRLSLISASSILDLRSGQKNASTSRASSSVSSSSACVKLLRWTALFLSYYSLMAGWLVKRNCISPRKAPQGKPGQLAEIIAVESRAQVLQSSIIVSACNTRTDPAATQSPTKAARASCQSSWGKTGLRDLTSQLLKPPRNMA